jgi:hypothetical protein
MYLVKCHLQDIHLSFLNDDDRHVADDDDVASTTMLISLHAYKKILKPLLALLHRLVLHLIFDRQHVDKKFSRDFCHFNCCRQLGM